MGIVDGLRDAYEDLQVSHLDLVAHMDAMGEAHREETRQVLEAPEGLER